MVFQNYALFPHMTIYENIAFPLRMRKQGEAAIRGAVRRVLDTVQLAGVEDRMPRELSGGQQQRIALARCFVYEPSIILMDEPLGALDKKLRDALQREVKHLHESLGITVLYVTHDQEEAMVMSDRICLMNDACIEQIGTPADLYFRPASVFAADFLGESNLLPATVAETGDGEVVLSTGDGRSIRACGGDDVEPGERVKYMVRPENVDFVDGAEPGNTVEGVLKETIMSGQITKYFLELPDGSEMVATRLTGGARGNPATGEITRFGMDGGAYRGTQGSLTSPGPWLPPRVRRNGPAARPRSADEYRRGCGCGPFTRRWCSWPSSSSTRRPCCSG